MKNKNKLKAFLLMLVYTRRWEISVKARAATKCLDGLREENQFLELSRNIYNKFYSRPYCKLSNVHEEL